MTYRDIYGYKIDIPEFIDDDDMLAIHQYVRRAIAESIIERRAETTTYMPQVTRKLLNKSTRDILSGMNVPKKLTVRMLERRLRDMITFVAEPIPSRLPCGEDDAFAERQHECRKQIPEVIDALIGLRREQMQARYERDW